MKKIVCIMLLVMSFYSCKKDCKTCPENYVLKNDECKCESGVIFDGECSSIEEFRAASGFIQEESPVCQGFEGVELYQYSYQVYDPGSGTNKMNLFFFGDEVVSERAVLYAVGNDSFRSAMYKEGVNGITFKNNGGVYFEKQIDNETCYLRCNVKMLSPRHAKYYFYFANKSEERKSDYCIRHFYQP